MNSLFTDNARGTLNLRPYQTEAAEAALATDNGLLVQPTGSGKSMVCAALVNAIEGRCVILQPSKEILESNFAKIKGSGYEGATIFSAR